jgi:hypothetical protein
VFQSVDFALDVFPGTLDILPRLHLIPAWPYFTLGTCPHWRSDANDGGSKQRDQTYLAMHGYLLF